MKTFDEGDVTVHGTRLHYYRSTAAGSAGRAVVLLHGVTDDGLCWSRVVQALTGPYDLVLLDARSHGKSDAPTDGYSNEDRAGDVAGLITSLELDRPVLVGHSMGADTAIATAAVYPHLVRAVLLEDPPWPGRFFGSTLEERAERASQWRAEIMQQKALSREDLITKARLNNPTWDESEIIPWADAKRAMHPNLVGLVTAPRRRWSDYVKQAECPILLLTGDPELGAIVSARAVEDARLVWKKGRVAHIPGAGHSIHRDQFQRYMQTLQEFLHDTFHAGSGV